MPIIRATCSNCGDVELTSTELKILYCNQTREWSYAFQCPSCKKREARPVEGRVVDILMAAGCRVTYWDRPRESSHQCRDKPLFTEDDASSFCRALEFAGTNLAGLAEAEGFYL